MRQAVGSSLKFPCDPACANSAATCGAGCMSCAFLNPGALSEDQEFVTWVGAIPEKDLSIRCSIAPGGPLIAPLSSLLELFSGGKSGLGKIVVSSTAKVTIPEEL